MQCTWWMVHRTILGAHFWCVTCKHLHFKQVLKYKKACSEIQWFWTPTMTRLHERNHEQLGSTIEHTHVEKLQRRDGGPQGGVCQSPDSEMLSKKIHILEVCRANRK